MTKIGHILTLSLLIVSLGCQPGGQQEAEAPADTTVEPAQRTWEQEHELFRPGYADSVNQGLTEDTFVGSARREVSGTIGGSTVRVNYGSPGKRGRVLWNGLVSYDQIWVSGSHWATAVTFDQAVEVAGKEIPAGMYGFFTIPGRETWTLIVNERFDQHLADDYQEAEDVVRVTAVPVELEEVVERLTYEVVETGENQGEIRMAWDQIQVAMPFSVVQ